MFAALMNGLINLLATVIQLICWPINQVITAALPDLTSWVTQAATGLNTLVNSMSWAMGLVPAGIKEIIAFMLLVEIAKHTIFMSTDMLIKVWGVLQKIKFW